MTAAGLPAEIAARPGYQAEGSGCIAAGHTCGEPAAKA